MSTLREEQQTRIDSLFARAAEIRAQPWPAQVSVELNSVATGYANAVIESIATDLQSRRGWERIGREVVSITSDVEHPAIRFWAAVFYDRVEVSPWASLVWRKAYETARYGEPIDYWAEDEEIRTEADAAYERATK